MRHTSDEIAIDHLALAILRKGENVVLVQQQDPGPSAPYWVLPGGLVEAGELAVEALVREVREEAGVEITNPGRLIALIQIDRPACRAQTLAFIFEVEQWRGELASQDPDGEVLRADLLPRLEAINRLEANGGWRGIQEPVLAYLSGHTLAGTLWCYREGPEGQRLINRLALQ